MPKIRNIKLAGETVGISVETVVFDDNGIGEIKSAELYQEVVKMNGFEPVEEVKQEVKEEPKQEENKEIKPKAPKK